MKYTPTELGIAASATISFILFLLAASKMPTIRLRHGRRAEVGYFALVSVVYFFAWFVAILLGRVLLGLNLAPVLRWIALFCILLPWVLVTLLHVLGFTFRMSW